MSLTNDIMVVQRDDGFINATLLCSNNGREFKTWRRAKATQEFLDALSKALNRTESKLVEIVNTGKNENRATWVHPRVAINIAHWCSPVVAVKVTEIILRYYQGDLSLAKEVVANYDQINKTSSEIEIRTTDLSKDFNVIKEMHSYLETLGCLDERTKLSLADNVKSMLLRNTNSNSEGITISSVASKLGLRLSLTQLQKVGKEIAKRYRMKNGVGPAKHSQYVDGAVRQVNSYSMKDIDLIRDVLEGDVPNQLENSIIYPGFKIHPIAKDGNCLFAAISY